MHNYRAAAQLRQQPKAGSMDLTDTSLIAICTGAVTSFFTAVFKDRSNERSAEQKARALLNQHTSALLDEYKEMVDALQKRQEQDRAHSQAEHAACQAENRALRDRIATLEGKLAVK